MKKVIVTVSLMLPCIGYAKYLGCDACIMGIAAASDSLKQRTDNKNTPDSIDVKQLNELVVEADNMYMTANKTSYVPTKQQRNASANGKMLLQQLAIPQLIVNVLAGSVTTNTGEAVSFFIDGVPAGDNDVADLNTRDVLRVEVLEHPEDPKFRNAAHVVNYVMQKYEFGGYTKLTTTEMFLSCFSSYNTLNSKMVYKNMTFDARAYYQYTNGSHYGTDDVQVYRLPGYEKEAPEGIIRSSLLENSKYISNTPSASFRALYNTDQTQLASTLNWSFSGIRSDDRNGILSYVPGITNADRWDSKSPLLKNTVSWNNEFFRQLPHDWALSAGFNLSYDHLNQLLNRSEGNTVIRDLTAKEDVWNINGEVDFSKKFSGKHTVSVNATCVTYKSDLEYTGSTINANHQTQFILAPGVSYTFNPDNTLYTYLGLYATYYRGKTGEVIEKKVYPTVNFNLSWMPRRRYRLGAMFNYSINTPSGSQTNPVLMQTDVFRWTQGNPNLHSYHTLYSQLSYTWMPSQYFNVTPVVSWVYKNNYFAETYSLTDDGKGILMSPDNCGNYHNIRGMISFSAYALKRKLILQAYPEVSRNMFKGMYDMAHTSLGATLSATYYLGQFYVGASYNTPKTYFNLGDPVKRKSHSDYWLMAGWGNASWTVSAFIINPLRNHWRGGSMSIDTPYYSLNSTTITVNDHRRINITVCYTLGYGKKVQRGNDLQGVSGGATSIR